MKVRNYYNDTKQIFLDVDLYPRHSNNGELLGYEYGEGGWWGLEYFKQELNLGLVDILEKDITPPKRIKKLTLI